MKRHLVSNTRTREHQCGRGPPPAAYHMVQVEGVDKRHRIVRNFRSGTQWIGREREEIILYAIDDQRVDQCMKDEISGPLSTTG